MDLDLLSQMDYRLVCKICGHSKDRHLRGNFSSIFGESYHVKCNDCLSSINSTVTLDGDASKLTDYKHGFRTLYLRSWEQWKPIKKRKIRS